MVHVEIVALPPKEEPSIIMPTYEYVCEKCGHEFELFQSMSSKPLSICAQEKCGCKTWGRGKVKRKIGIGAGLIFKGSGFYETDYRSESYKSGAKKDAESNKPAAKPANETSPKTESKTETKTPAPTPKKTKD